MALIQQDLITGSGDQLLTLDTDTSLNGSISLLPQTGPIQKSRLGLETLLAPMDFSMRLLDRSYSSPARWHQ